MVRRLTALFFVAMVLVGCKKKDEDIVDPPPVDQGVEHKVLAEVFTSSTCPPCRGANAAFDSWYSTYFKRANVIVVKYHVWWPSPGDDPFYLANPIPVQLRNEYYRNNYAPHMYVDGTVDATSDPAIWSSSASNGLSNKSNLSIALSGTRSGNSGSLNIKLTTGSDAVPSGLLLHVLVTESNLDFSGPNGETHFDWVFRSFVTQTDGMPLTLSQSATKDVQLNFSLSPAWLQANSAIVVFVQNGTTKQVLQAETVAVTALSGS